MNVFIALADANRRRIVEMLATGSRSAGDLAADFSISAPAVSQHLKALREARLVEVEVRGQQRIYTLLPEGFQEIDKWLLRTARFWSDRLDRLELAISQRELPSGRSNRIPTKRQAAAAQDGSISDPRLRSRRSDATQSKSKARTRRKS